MSRKMGLPGFRSPVQAGLFLCIPIMPRKVFARAVKDYIIGDAYKLVCIVSEKEGSHGLVRMYEKIYGFRKYARTINDTIVMGRTLRR